MKCPACGAENRRRDDVCFKCGARIRRTPARAAANAAMWTLFILAAAVVFSLLAYRVYFWFAAWQLNRVYASGARTEPQVEAIDLSNNRVGHAITFFGNDGDQVFIAELGRSYPFTGGVARIEVPDSEWFGENPEDAESAIVTLTPVVFREDGGRDELPAMELTIDAPTSPVTLINPTSTWADVNTSVYPLSLQVVPGSRVIVADSDVSDTVDYQGLLSVNINVYPQGENPVSVLVKTDNHKETRLDITLYRPYQEINLEPSLTLPKRSNRQNILISGSVDPAAAFSVDTPHVEDSVKVDEKGNFSFMAKLSVIGDNTVTFRATQEGKQDSVVSVNIYYVPSIDAYSRAAWKMDYENLLLCYEIWEGRVFLCDGRVAEVVVEDEKQTVYMDVGTEGVTQYIALENLSSVGTPEIGARYKAYADVVASLGYYDSKYCPQLICRYMSLVPET